MIIQCTKKLLDELNIKPAEKIEEGPLFSWHANIITANRRKTVVIVNDKNRYAIVLYGLKARDFKSFNKAFVNGLRETLRDECIKDEIIEDFIKASGEIFFAKTKDRASVARMNNACELAAAFEDEMVDKSISQPYVSTRISRFLVGGGANSYISPNEELYRDLEAFSEENIFRCRAVVLKVTLGLENHEVWRRIVVPLNITFDRLHRLFQSAFGWKNYHLHEFYIFDSKSSGKDLTINHPAYTEEGLKPIVNLVSSEEAFEYPGDIEMRYERGISLSEYLPEHGNIKYIYDFGDNWQHFIEVEKVLEDYDRNYPVCIEGAGNTPPEDVGGESGYEEFLEALCDKGHPEHRSMEEWGEGQGYREFDIGEVNKDISFYFRW